MDPKSSDLGAELPLPDSDGSAFESSDAEWQPPDGDTDSHSSDSSSVEQTGETIDKSHSDLHIVEESSECESDCSRTYPKLIKLPEDSATPRILIASTKRGKRNKWDKKHACKYCSNLIVKVSTHLQRKHKNEAEVARVLQLEKNSPERRKAWRKLLNEGDYLHNYTVYKDGKGVVIPRYRTSTEKNAVAHESFKACPFCKGLYNERFLTEHAQRCKPAADPPLKMREARKAGEFLLPVPRDMTRSFFHKVLGSMNRDEVWKANFFVKYCLLMFHSEIEAFICSVCRKSSLWVYRKWGSVFIHKMKIHPVCVC